MKRKSVTEKVESMGVYDLDGTVDKLIERLVDLRKRYGENLVIDVDHGYYDDDYSINVYWNREETDEEFEKRKKKERRLAETRRKNREKDKALKEKQEREEYERLKEKFENS